MTALIACHRVLAPRNIRRFVPNDTLQILTTTMKGSFAVPVTALFGFDSHAGNYSGDKSLFEGAQKSCNSLMEKN